MTLVISVFAHDRYLQVSDRRLFDPNEGRPVDAPANKMIGVGCVDADFVIGYSGLATFFRDENPLRPDEWMFEIFTKNKLGKLGLDQFLKTLAIELEIQLRNPVFGGRIYPVTFGLVGRCRDRTFSGWLSNGTLTDGDLGTPYSHRFSSRLKGIPLDRPIKWMYSGITVNGSCRSIRDFVKAKFAARRSEKFFINESNQAIVEEMVGWVRAAADMREAEDGIGKDCMAMSRMVDGDSLAMYYPENAGPESFGPYVLGPEVSYGDMRTWSGPNPPTWW